MDYIGCSQYMTVWPCFRRALRTFYHVARRNGAGNEGVTFSISTHNLCPATIDDGLTPLSVYTHRGPETSPKSTLILKFIVSKLLL